MKYAEHSRYIPNELYHDPTLVNYNKNTVAMIFASRGIIPPKEW